jgi:hypothetical protein
MKASERFQDAVRSRIEPEAPHGEALRLARGIAERGGPGVLAVVFFGSRKTQAQPDPYSAYDFFVVTENYRGFYDSLRSSGALSRNPALVAALNVSLPPNQIRLVDEVDGTVS